jgi:thymidylate synthase (FAD)
MKFIEQSAEIFSPENGLIQNPEKYIESIGRHGNKSVSKMKEEQESHDKFCKARLVQEHTSIFEFVDITMHLVTSIAVSRELLRHRHINVNEISTRYCDESNLEIIIPEWIKPVISKTGIENINDIDIDDACIDCCIDNNLKALYTWMKNMKHAEKTYNSLFEYGCTREMARGILPLDTMTDMLYKTNVTQWRFIFKRREDKAAHPDMRYLMKLTRQELIKYSSVLFEGTL